MWWLPFSPLVKGAASITLIGSAQFLWVPAALAVMLWLLMSIGGQGSHWSIDEVNSSDKRLIIIRDTDGRVNISPTTKQEIKSIDELLNSWKGKIGERAGTLTKNQKVRFDLQGHTRDELFINLQIQRNEGRSGSRGRQQGGGANSSSTTLAQVFIPTEVKDLVKKEDIIAAVKASINKGKAVVLTPSI